MIDQFNQARRSRPTLRLATTLRSLVNQIGSDRSGDRGPAQGLPSQSFEGLATVDQFHGR
jgi:hypothetical protein